MLTSVIDSGDTNKRQIIANVARLYCKFYCLTYEVTDSNNIDQLNCFNQNQSVIRQGFQF